MNFFHTADLHFGVENYGKLDPVTGIHSRLLDFKKSLEFVVTAAIAEKIDFFLLCGDAYKTAHPTPTQQKFLLQQLLALQQANIPVVIIVGNHDHPLSFGKANALDVFSDLPLEGLYVFSKPESRTIQTKRGPVQIVGIPWPTKNNLVTHEEHRFKNAHEIASYISQRVGDMIAGFAATLDPKLPAVLAGHLTVSTGVFSGSEKCAIMGTDPVFLPSQLAIAPFDYVALGHLHRYQNLNAKGAPIVYPGSIERVDFGERKEEKGFCSVTIEQAESSKNCRFEFIKTPIRPMFQIEVWLEGEQDQTEQVLASIKKESIDGAILKILYHVPLGFKDMVDLPVITRACSKAHYVAGIVPVYQVVKRETRVALKSNMDLDTLLEKYLTSKMLAQTVLQEKQKNELLLKAKLLQQELQEKQNLHEEGL
jgi:exonuclease SbcD